MKHTSIMRKCLLSLTVIMSLGTYCPSSNAALLTYDIQVDIDSGPLQPNNYNATLTYDDSTLTGSGTELINIVSFNFSFEGTTYTKADDPTATVEYFDGQFLGLNYAVFNTPSPTFSAGFSDLLDATFAYDLGGAGQGGTGTLTYDLQPTEVPEPSALVGLLMFSGILVATRCKSSSK